MSGREVRRLYTRDEALAKAAAALEWAECETDMARMERVTELANSWMTLASIMQGDGDAA